MKINESPSLLLQEFPTEIQRIRPYSVLDRGSLFRFLSLPTFRVTAFVALLAGVTLCLALNRFASPGQYGFLEIALLITLLAATGRIGFNIISRSRIKTAVPDNKRAGMALSLLLISTTFVAIQATSGIWSILYPALYLMVAFMVTLYRSSKGIALALFAVAIEFIIAVAQGHLTKHPVIISAHLSYLMAFALLNLIILQLELFNQRRLSRQNIEAAVQRLKEEAEDYRIISSTLGSESRLKTREEEERKLACGAALAIKGALLNVLEMVNHSVKPYTCILLWLNAEGSYFKIKELITQSDNINEHPVRAGEGVFGGILKQGRPVNLKDLASSFKGVPYYKGAEGVRCFLGAPVMDNGYMRGVICIDRLEDRPFTDADQCMLTSASRQILNAVENERLLNQADRAKYEQERFFKASDAFNSVRTLDDVYKVTFSSTRELAPYELGAITRFDAQTRAHTIVRTSGDPVLARKEGHTFKENAGFVSMVVKNRHFLPYGGKQKSQALIFDQHTSLRKYESLLVLPLVSQDEVVGTLVMASRRPNFFSREKREMLTVIASQAAVSMENALAYEKMAEMATTDGLTKLRNHRNFQDKLDEMLARADRLSKPLTLIMTDIDHFKSVNDNYGHPVGDKVLKEVAGVLTASVRQIDMVARYGGEEFAIVLEETERKGAYKLAERIRQDIADRRIYSEKGEINITISMGIACYPEDTRDKLTFVRYADQALYKAKNSGRNRTVVHGSDGE